MSGPLGEISVLTDPYSWFHEGRVATGRGGRGGEELVHGE